MTLQFLKPACVCFFMLAIGVPLSAQAQHFHELDKNFCILKIGPYGMHLTGYQPDSSAQQELGGDLASPSFPTRRSSDLEDALRPLPTEVRVIKDTGSEQDLQAITVLHLPPKVYPNGTVNFEYNFDHPGKFVGLVTVGDKQELVSRFPFSVGETKIPLPPTYFMIAFAGTAAVGVILFVLLGRRKSSDVTVSLADGHPVQGAGATLAQ